MHSLTRHFRVFSTSSSYFIPILPSRFPRPIKEMTPQFNYLSSPSPPVIYEETTQSVLAEVLRCHSFFDQTVLDNTVKVLTLTKARGPRAEGISLAKMRFIAIVYHSISDGLNRQSLKDLAKNVEKCKIPLMRKEQELFFMSMFPSDDIPELAKCMHKNDLVLCYFRRELESKNWQNIKKIISRHPRIVELYEHIDAFLEVANHQKVDLPEIMEVFMSYTAKIKNPYFMEIVDFETVLRKIAKSYSAKVSENYFGNQKLKKSYVSKESLNILKQRIDQYVKNSKEGYVKTKEYDLAVRKVREWKKEKKIKDGENVVVVDALNFGLGVDPKEWKSISDQFKHVIFATRQPPLPVRKQVIKRYRGNALFCDELSADDLIILRMALEFGSQTCLVTNDQYRDHRLAICNGEEVLENIWDEFLVDAIHRHFDGRIESHRTFNLRICNINGKWFIPVLDSEGYCDKFRNIKVYCIENNIQ